MENISTGAGPEMELVPHWLRLLTAREEPGASLLPLVAQSFTPVAHVLTLPGVPRTLKPILPKEKEHLVCAERGKDGTWR